ncbi:DUF2946 domain-containing protein [Thalassospira lucentensis]|uniref:DUF2946 domain-containing protein n=1 Tax=Thalassospira lucentensis TaxID=168935 RepID=UPI00142E3E76|nr:DUF2946 domain-containing protein [Thalassospira lucentensis]NIZ01261.1 hypothetical protein [Thalassospira lucentensis]
MFRHIPLRCRHGLSAVVALFFLCNTVMFGFMHVPMAKAEGVSLASIVNGKKYIPIVICTGTGLETILVSPDGEKTTPDGGSPAVKGFQCALCGLGNYTFAMPVEAQLPDMVRVRLSNAVTALHITARLHDFCPIAASPRAPPRPSVPHFTTA